MFIVEIKESKKYTSTIIFIDIWSSNNDEIIDIQTKNIIWYLLIIAFCIQRFIIEFKFNAYHYIDLFFQGRTGHSLPTFNEKRNWSHYAITI